MVDLKNGYSICLNEWVFDKDIKNELNLLLIISSLCAKGYCYATNTYFSELFNITEETVSRKLKILEEKGYITIDYVKRGCEIIQRNIRLSKISIDDYQKYQSTIDKNVKENNINIYKESEYNKLYSKESIAKSNKKVQKSDDSKTKFGIYKRVLLTQNEYEKLCKDYSKEVIDNQIELLDEYLESNNNKNKYSNYNIVLRKSIRENWFKAKEQVDKYAGYVSLDKK